MASIEIPAGRTWASFMIDTSPVQTSTTVTITASHSVGSTSTGAVETTKREATITVAPAVLHDLSCLETTVTGGHHEVTCKVTLTGPAPAVVYPAGLPPRATVTSSDTSVATAPWPQVPYGGVHFTEGKTWAEFQVLTDPQQVQKTADIKATYGGVSETVTLTVIPPVLDDFRCYDPPPRYDVAGGSEIPCEVGLTGPPYAPYIDVTMSNTNTAVASVSSPVRFEVGGGSWRSIPVGTFNVTDVKYAKVKAEFVTSVERLITVRPIALQSFVCTPLDQAGGNPVYCKVTLNGPAPAPSGLVIPIQSDSAVAEPDPEPDEAMFNPGETEAEFAVTTVGVPQTTYPTLRVTHDGVSMPVVLTVRPASILRVLLNGLPNFYLDGQPPDGQQIAGFVELDGQSVSEQSIELTLATESTTYRRPAIVKVDEPPVQNLGPIPVLVKVPDGARNVGFTLLIYKCSTPNASNVWCYGKLTATYRFVAKDATIQYRATQE